MIWDYQRNGVFTVIWHGGIELDSGELIKVTGYLSEPGVPEVITAKAIVERDGTVHEQPYADGANLLTQELYPVEGRVYDCRRRANDTIISLYQTIPNLFSFPNLSHHRAFLVLPEFWNFLEERSEYGELVVPRGRQLLELKGDQYKLPDIRKSTWSICRYGALAGLFTGEFVPEICGKICSKLEQLSRLTKRSAFGNRMKLHLFTLSVSEGRSYLLDELAYEAPMTLEHGSLVAYSSLDLLAELVNRTLKLGIETKEAGFTSVLGKASAEPGAKCLCHAFPGHPVTKFWVEQQSTWVARLRDIRHYFAHGGTAIPVHGPNERLIASKFDNSVETVNEIYDVEEEVTQWLENTTAFFVRTLQLLANHSGEAVKPLEQKPVLPSTDAPTVATELESAFRDLLVLIFQSTAENPAKAKHLYSRLEPNWRKRWKWSKFEAFLAAWEGAEMKPNEPVMVSTSDEKASMTTTILYTIAGLSLPWTLQFEKTKHGKPSLVGSKIAIPCYPEDLTSIDNYEARQSGVETGHACAEFRFRLSNRSSDKLQDVLAIVMHGGVEVARAEAGNLGPGDARDIYAITTRELGTFRPPGSPYMFVILINEPVAIRIVYHRETNYGDEWAEEHTCVNSPR